LYKWKKEMADKLTVRDFGPIREAELDIKKTTVLIGPQGSGKSTLAKLVAMIQNKPFHGTEPLTERTDFFLEDFDIQDYKKDNTLITYISELIDVVINKEKFQYSGNSDMIKPLLVPTERNLISMISSAIFGLTASNIALPNHILAFGAEYELFRRNTKDVVISFLGITYKNIRGLDFVFYSKDEFLPLSSSASGYQSIVPILLVLENSSKYYDSKWFIIEEPELNLFPVTQRHLMHYIISKCNDETNKLLLTTHSPYVLSSLNNLLFAYKVAQKYPEHAEDVAKIIPKESWLNPEEFAAYYVADGTVRSIVNPKTGLISENELDGVSEDIGDEFDALMEIYAAK
jgi:predicted ATPase